MQIDDRAIAAAAIRLADAHAGTPAIHLSSPRRDSVKRSDNRSPQETRSRAKITVERAFAHLHWFRRLRIRWEIRDDIHEAFLTLGMRTHLLATPERVLDGVRCRGDPPGSTYRRTRRAAASRRGCPSTADDKRKRQGDCALPATLNL